MAFVNGECELLEFSESQNCVFFVETEKQREHDCQITGCDFNPYRGLLVTADVGGVIRIWNKDKRFLREMQFPHQVDSVCFFDQNCDLLVSHENRISLIPFKNYWTKTFDHYGITDWQSEESLKLMDGYRGLKNGRASDCSLFANFMLNTSQD